MCKRLFLIVTAAAAGMICISGCNSSGSGGGVDLHKTVDQIRTEVQKMDVEQIKAEAMKYKKAITAKTAEVDKLMQKLKDVPATKVLTDEYKVLKGNIDEINSTIKGLKERLDVYIGKLKDLKAEVSGLAV